MERIVALEIAEHQRFEWLKKQKQYYRESGDWSIYALPPVILLDDIPFDSYIDIPEVLEASEAVFDGSYSYLKTAAKHTKGLFISKSDKALGYDFGKFELKPTRILLIELKDFSFRIIATRPLSTGKEKLESI